MFNNYFSVSIIRIKTDTPIDSQTACQKTEETTNTLYYSRLVIQKKTRIGVELWKVWNNM